MPGKPAVDMVNEGLLTNLTWFPPMLYSANMAMNVQECHRNLRFAQVVWSKDRNKMQLKINLKIHGRNLELKRGTVY